MFNMIQRLKSKKGFTLVELIVVIAIIAILAAILVPLMTNYIRDARVSGAMTAAGTLETASTAFLFSADSKDIGRKASVTGVVYYNIIIKKDGTVEMATDDVIGSWNKANSIAGTATYTADTSTAVTSATPDNCFFGAVGKGYIDRGAGTGIISVEGDRVIAVAFTPEIGATAKSTDTIVAKLKGCFNSDGTVKEVVVLNNAPAAGDAMIVGYKGQTGA